MTKRERISFMVGTGKCQWVSSSKQQKLMSNHQIVLNKLKVSNVQNRIAGYRTIFDMKRKLFQDMSWVMDNKWNVLFQELYFFQLSFSEEWWVVTEFFVTCWKENVFLKRSVAKWAYPALGFSQQTKKACPKVSYILSQLMIQVSLPVARHPD